MLVNTAIARADDPAAMARAFRLGVEAGRAARLAGLIEESRDGRGLEPDHAASSRVVTVTVQRQAQLELEPGETVESLLDELGARRAVRARRAERRAGRARALRRRVALEEGDTLVVARPSPADSPGST